MKILGLLIFATLIALSGLVMGMKFKDVPLPGEPVSSRWSHLRAPSRTLASAVGGVVKRFCCAFGRPDGDGYLANDPLPKKLLAVDVLSAGRTEVGYLGDNPVRIRLAASAAEARVAGQSDFQYFASGHFLASAGWSWLSIRNGQAAGSSPAGRSDLIVAQLAEQLNPRPIFALA